MPRVDEHEITEWTNESVLRLAGGQNPITAIEKRARDLVLRAKDAGWSGPPFNPVAIADLLGIPVEPTESVVDARTVPGHDGVRIEFNPKQARERVRFTIAHEISHTLFADVNERVRNRGRVSHAAPDDWQLEVLCNIAAAEFVMPTGSLSTTERVSAIEDLMVERREFDVSAEAFLIRVVKTTREPIAMFCASSAPRPDQTKNYRIDYVVSSGSAPRMHLRGLSIPSTSVVYSCSAIGYTAKGTESWFAPGAQSVECVGLPGYPGQVQPRVAGLVRFSKEAGIPEGIRFVHGDVLNTRGDGTKVICQMVNDRARSWGGGVARSSRERFPDAQREFSKWLDSVPRSGRLGKVHFASVGKGLFIGSLVAQHGYGPSAVPRIRYAALSRCLDEVAEFCVDHAASVHIPRIGAGQAGGNWEVVEEIVRTELVAQGIPVTVYSLPPRRPQLDLFERE